MKFESKVQNVGTLDFPDFSGTRVMMMPIDFEELENCIPEFLSHWEKGIKNLVAMSQFDSGVGYITIDETEVEPGETQRRPGKHVDGVGPDGIEGKGGAWGGGGSWGGRGMLLSSTVTGCRTWEQEFSGKPKPGGDCDHLTDQCKDENEIVMEPYEVYRCNPLNVHEAMPIENEETVKRQFIRLSNPNDAPWYEGYTENPTGVEPAGPIHDPRTEQMNYRSDS